MGLAVFFSDKKKEWIYVEFLSKKEDFFKIFLYKFLLVWYNGREIGEEDYDEQTTNRRTCEKNGE